MNRFFSHSDAFPPTPMNYRSGKKVTFETKNNILFKGDIDLKVAPKYVVPVEGIIQMGKHIFVEVIISFKRLIF